MYSVWTEKYHLFRVALASPDIRVADVAANADKHIALIREAAEEKAQLIVFPRLSLVGTTAGDLLEQDILYRGVEDALARVVEATLETDIISAIGVPFRTVNGIYTGHVLIRRGIVIKCFLDYRDPDPGLQPVVRVLGEEFMPDDAPVLLDGTSFGLRLYYSFREAFAREIDYPAGLALVADNGAELAGTASFVRESTLTLSRMCGAAVGYLSPAHGESTTSRVYSGRRAFAQGVEYVSGPLYSDELFLYDIDFDKVAIKSVADHFELSTRVPAGPDRDDTLYQNLSRSPFLPENPAYIPVRFEHILTIAAYGLAKRLRHIGSPKLVMGLSGGLDSTLALLIALRAMTILGESPANIHAVTMPGFGTGERTRSQADILAEAAKVRISDIPIDRAVSVHFEDIGQDPDHHDVTFENAQARERTQILMDLANKEGGLVLGTGDLSEIALGFSTYNGDHMSMYNVNASIPKILMQQLVRYEAERYGETDDTMRDVLIRIVETPISPELLPSAKDSFDQRTEAIIGPYELHDFFLYHLIRYRMAPVKIRFLAEKAFAGVYDRETIDQWLRVFLKRFFNNQFKRNAAPDSPAVGSVNLGTAFWTMPSDAVGDLWIDSLDDPEDDVNETYHPEDDFFTAYDELNPFTEASAQDDESEETGKED